MHENDFEGLDIKDLFADSLLREQKMKANRAASSIMEDLDLYGITKEDIRARADLTELLFHHLAKSIALAIRDISDGEGDANFMLGLLACNMLIESVREKLLDAATS
jgi:hypothetical protein